MVVRLSIGVFLLRLLVEKWTRIAVWTTLIVMSAFSTFYALFTIFQCWPVEYFWTRWDGLITGENGGAGWCLPYADVPDSSIAQGVMAFLADVSKLEGGVTYG